MANKSDFPKFPKTGCKTWYMPRHDFQKCPTCQAFKRSKYGKAKIEEYLNALANWYDEQGYECPPQTWAE